MKSTFDEMESGLGLSRADISPPFRVLILCEDATAKNEAIRLCEHLTGRIAMGCRLEMFGWDLENPKDLKALVKEVTVADMIFVAGCDGSKLSGELKSALTDGLSTRRVERGALVALLGRANVQDRNPSPLHSYLKQTAQGTGLQFFPGVFEMVEKKPAWTIDSIHERAERMTPTLLGILRRRVTPFDYGTNE